MTAGRDAWREVLRRYHERAESWQLDRVVSRHEGLNRSGLVRAGEDDSAVSVVGDWPGEALLAATGSSGLILIGRGVPRVLFPGAFYGVTRAGDRWLAFQRQRFGGRIIAFRLDGDRPAGVEVLIWGLSPGVHQIDVIEDELWVTDTYNNRLLRYPVRHLDRPRSWRRTVARHLPCGRLAHGRGSANYRHLNSILCLDDAIHVVAHNETAKSGRPSSLLRLGSDGTVLDERTLSASNAHNVVLVGPPSARRLICCASMEGTLRDDGEDVFASGLLTRGLAVGPSQVAVGGSALADRAERSQGDSTIFYLNRGYDLMGQVTLPHTQIHELRFVDVPDLGLSRCAAEQQQHAPARR